MMKKNKKKTYEYGPCPHGHTKPTEADLKAGKPAPDNRGRGRGRGR